MHETVFRGLLQKTKDTITKAVKDNLPPEIGEEVTDLVLNVRPASKEQKMKKPSDTTIGKKVRQMLEADSKQEHLQQLRPPAIPRVHTADAKETSSAECPLPLNVKKPAQLTKNPSALCHDDAAKETFSIDTSPPSSEEVVLLTASNRPNTPKTNAKIDRKIGSTTVAAFASGINCCTLVDCLIVSETLTYTYTGS
jgi:hypothetical protein